MTVVAETLESALTPEWMTSALGVRYPGVVVTAVHISDTLHGVATKALVTLEYEGDPGLPSRMCLKAGYEPHNKHILDGGTYLREARFYGEIAGTVPVEVPTVYYAGYDEATKQGVLLMEDLNTAGAQFGSALRGFSVDEAGRFVEGLAALHATYWGRAAEVFPWLRGPLPLATSSSGANIYIERLSANLQDGRADGIPAEYRDPDRLLAAATALAHRAQSLEGCLVHGDCHAGNLYLTADGRPGWYDWQTVQAAVWAVDVPYYISAALTHDDRRAARDDLLRRYLDGVARRGVPAPSWEDALLLFRQFLVYPLYLWAITRPIVQPVEVINTFVDRLGNAAAEAGSFEALGV